jgi:hypothetical protein
VIELAQTKRLVDQGRGGSKEQSLKAQELAFSYVTVPRTDGSNPDASTVTEAISLLVHLGKFKDVMSHIAIMQPDEQIQILQSPGTVRALTYEGDGVAAHKALYNEDNDHALALISVIGKLPRAHLAIILNNSDVVHDFHRCGHQKDFLTLGQRLPLSEPTILQPAPPIKNGASANNRKATGSNPYTIENG